MNTYHIVIELNKLYTLLESYNYMPLHSGGYTSFDPERKTIIKEIDELRKIIDKLR